MVEQLSQELKHSKKSELDRELAGLWGRLSHVTKGVIITNMRYEIDNDGILYYAYMVHLYTKTGTGLRTRIPVLSWNSGSI